MQIPCREQDVASTRVWSLTSMWVYISLSRETIAESVTFDCGQNRKLQSGPTPPEQYSSSRHKHMLKRWTEVCSFGVWGLSSGSGQRGNGWFPSPATALWLNWSGLLDLSACTRLCAPMKHLLKQPWAGRVNCSQRVESAERSTSLSQKTVD